MSIIVESAALSRGLKTIAPFAPRFGAVPVLSSVVVEGHSGALILRASDMDVEAAVTVPADTNGTRLHTAISGAGDLPRMLRYAGAKTVTLDPVDESGTPGVRCRAQDLIVTPQAHHHDRHPSTLSASRAPLAWHALRLDLSTEAMEALLNAAAFASTDERWVSRRGVAIQRDPHGSPWAFRVCATSGYALYMRTFSAPDATTDAEWSGWDIIPQTAITRLRPLLRAALRDGEAVSMTLGTPPSANSVDAHSTLTSPGRSTARRPTHAEFQRGDWRVRTRLVDGTYPDVDRVVPDTKPMTQVSFDRRALTTAAQALAGLAQRRSTDRAVKISLDGAGRCTLSRTVYEAGACETSLDYTPAPEARALTIGLNVGLLLQALRQFSGAETVVVQAASDSDPVLLMAEDAPGLRVVIMPMRV